MQVTPPAGGPALLRRPRQRAPDRGRRIGRRGAHRPGLRAAARPPTGSGARSTAGTSSPPRRRHCAVACRPRTWATRWTPLSLVRLTGGVVEQGRLSDGRSCMRAEVLWVDHFGNMQLAATRPTPRPPACHPPARWTSPSWTRATPRPPGRDLRRSGPGELGLLIDANGHVAVVAGEASAASQLEVVGRCCWSVLAW